MIDNPVERVEDVDALGFPARHLLPNGRYSLENEFIGGRAFHVLATRGCPFQCAFCSAAAIWGRRWTTRTPAHVVEEMESLRDDFGAKGIRFMDALVTQKRSYLLELCGRIQERGVGLPWECEVRVDTIDEEMLRAMREAGCYYLDFGAESINPRVLAGMRKAITPEQIQSALILAHDLGFRTKVFFTIGHIEEIVEEARETLEFIHRNRRRISRIGGTIGLHIYPGTELESYAHQIGCLSGDFSWSQPYHEKDNLYFSAPPSVPMLLQPQMDRHHLQNLRRRHLWIKFQDPNVLLANLRRLTSLAGLRRCGSLARGVVRRAEHRPGDPL